MRRCARPSSDVSGQAWTRPERRTLGGRFKQTARTATKLFCICNNYRLQACTRNRRRAPCWIILSRLPPRGRTYGGEMARQIRKWLWTRALFGGAALALISPQAFADPAPDYSANLFGDLGGF